MYVQGEESNQEVMVQTCRGRRGVTWLCSNNTVHALPHHHLYLLLQPQLPPPSSSPRTPSLLSRPPCWQFQQAHVDGVAVSLASHPAPQPMQPHSATHPTMSHLLQHVDPLLIPQVSNITVVWICGTLCNLIILLLGGTFSRKASVAEADVSPALGKRGKREARRAT